MYNSGSYLYQIIGDPKFVDRVSKGPLWQDLLIIFQVERIAYNALPGTLTGGLYSVIADSSLSLSRHVVKTIPPATESNSGAKHVAQSFPSRRVSTVETFLNPPHLHRPYSNVFGLEPNYPCCTVNHPQGWPKFITNAFLTTPDQGSLIHIYLGPFSTTTTLANSRGPPFFNLFLTSTDNSVNVNVNTLYPFSDTLTTTITATKAFTYYVRIPNWVVGGTISINGAAAKALAPSNGLQAVTVNAGRSSFVLDLPANITTESRPHGSIAVHRGPLHYAFDSKSFPCSQSRPKTTLHQSLEAPKS